MIKKTTYPPLHPTSYNWRLAVLPPFDDFQNALAFISLDEKFGVVTSIAGAQYHLSISKREGGHPSDEEVKTILADFEMAKAKEDSEPLNNHISLLARHFWLAVEDLKTRKDNEPAKDE